MKAAVLHSSPGRLEIEDLATDKPTSREVLVRTAHAGLCHSDLHFMDGAWQVGGATVMGHEGAGIVEAVGAGVRDIAVGDRVGYVDPLGAYAEVLLRPAKRLIKLPDAISCEMAAAMPGKGLALSTGTSEPKARRTPAF